METTCTRRALSQIAHSPRCPGRLWAAWACLYPRAAGGAGLIREQEPEGPWLQPRATGTGDRSARVRCCRSCSGLSWSLWGGRCPRSSRTLSTGRWGQQATGSLGWSRTRGRGRGVEATSMGDPSLGLGMRWAHRLVPGWPGLPWPWAGCSLVQSQSRLGSWIFHLQLPPVSSIGLVQAESKEDRDTE